MSNLNLARAIFSIVSIGLGLLLTIKSARFGVFIQTMPMLVGTILAIVCCWSGSGGCSTILITMICVFLCALFVVMFCPMVSPPYQRNDEIPYIIFGATIGCIIGLRISRWWNRPKP